MRFRLTQMLLVSTFLPLAVLSQSRVALAGPTFCPAPGTPPVCAGRSAGDLVLTGGAAGVVGLNPTTGQFYIFSTAFTAVDDAELQGVVPTPDDPLHLLIIGDVDSHETGIAEIDDCGNELNPLNTTPDPLWGQFANFPPELDHAGTNNRGIAVSTSTGVVYSPGVASPASPTMPVFTGAPTLYTFPSLGGVDSFISTSGATVDATNNGAVTFDELGDMFLGNGLGAIAEYTAATLATSAPIQTLVPPNGQLISSVEALIGDGSGSLFVAGMGGGGALTEVFKVNIATGATVVWTSLGGSQLGGIFTAIAIDASGNLWLTEKDTVFEISGTSGTILQTFTVPASLESATFELGGIRGITVLGVNPPAIRTACADAPLFRLAEAMDAATGSLNLNPPAAQIDSYLSCKGPYGGSNILSNGNVEAAQGVTVNGGGQIHGAVIRNTASGNAPFAAPAGLVSRGDLNVNTPLTLAAGDYLFGNINVNTGGSITGSGGLVRIWYQHGVNLNGNVTAVGDAPANLWLFGLPGSGSVNLNADVTMFGVIYAPTDSVSLNPGSTVFGAVVGSAVTLNGAKVHFDEVLDGATCP